MTKGIQYDLTGTALATFGGRNIVNREESHNMYSINSNILAPFKNNYKGSFTAGQAWNYNSALSKNWLPTYGKKIQRSTILGFKTGDFSAQISNDTKWLLADGGDKGHTGQGTAIYKSHEITYQNFTGAYKRSQEKGGEFAVSYPNKYDQEIYHKSLNQSFFGYKFNKINPAGGPDESFYIQGYNHGSGQNGIHSLIGTAKFDYADDWRINIGASIGFYGTF